MGDVLWVLGYLGGAAFAWVFPHILRVYILPSGPLILVSFISHFLQLLGYLACHNAFLHQVCGSKYKIQNLDDFCTLLAHSALSSLLSYSFLSCWMMLGNSCFSTTLAVVRKFMSLHAISLVLRVSGIVAVPLD